MNRQGGSFAAPRPSRGARGWAAEAAYGGGYPQDAQLLGPALDTGAYPVDPGYRGRTSDGPRPADMPPGPSHTRPERGMPPRPGFPPRPSRQAPRNPGAANRPWPRPEEAAPQPAGGRPRPRPGRGQADGRGPVTERPRPQAAGRSRPTAEETIMSNGRRVPPNGSPTPPRAPRPAGFYDRGTDYDPTPGGPHADGRSRGQAGRNGRAGQPGPQYGQQYGAVRAAVRAAVLRAGGRSVRPDRAGAGLRAGACGWTGSPGARPVRRGAPAPTDTGNRGPTNTDRGSLGRRRGGPAPASPGRRRPNPASPGTGRSTRAPRLARSGQPGTGRPGVRVRASTGRASTSRPSTSRPSTSRPSTGRTRRRRGSSASARGTPGHGRPRAPLDPLRARAGRAARGSTPKTLGTPDPGRPRRDRAGRVVTDSRARASGTPGLGRRQARIRDTRRPRLAGGRPGSRAGLDGRARAIRPMAGRRTRVRAQLGGGSRRVRSGPA